VYLPAHLPCGQVMESWRAILKNVRPNAFKVSLEDVRVYAGDTSGFVTCVEVIDADDSVGRCARRAAATGRLAGPEPGPRSPPHPPETQAGWQGRTRPPRSRTTPLPPAMPNMREGRSAVPRACAATGRPAGASPPSTCASEQSRGGRRRARRASPRTASAVPNGRAAQAKLCQERCLHSLCVNPGRSSNHTHFPSMY
jgi:hypothetical protein